MSFPIVALGEVVKYRKDFIQIDDLANYKRCRVQLHAQGIGGEDRGGAGAEEEGGGGGGGDLGE